MCFNNVKKLLNYIVIKNIENMNLKQMKNLKVIIDNNIYVLYSSINMFDIKVNKNVEAYKQVYIIKDYF